MKKREQYNYFYVDAFTYQTMHDEALKEMNRVKNKKNDKQRREACFNQFFFYGRICKSNEVFFLIVLMILEERKQ